MFISYFHVYRPLTPPYMRFRIRRFRAFSSHDVWQVVFSHPFDWRHFYSIVGFRPIVWIERSFSDIWLQKSLRVAVIYFALPDSALPHRHTCLRYYGFCWLLTASVTPSWYIEWIHLHSCVRETSPVKRIIFPSYTHLIYYVWFRVVIGLWCFLPSHPHI